MKHYVKSLATPVGTMILAATDKAVVALVWKPADLARMGITEWNAGETCALLGEAERQLREYFRGERSEFDLPLELEGTEFQKRVWKELTRIPFGETWSYRELAARVGNPKAARAVGSANGRNPVSIFVPCHRVVRETGERGGYAGGMRSKAFLLELEAKR